MDQPSPLINHCLNRKPYKGYVCLTYGLGSVLFRGPAGDEALGRPDHPTAWAMDAWHQAKAEIDARSAEMKIE